LLTGARRFKEEYKVLKVWVLKVFQVTLIVMIPVMTTPFRKLSDSFRLCFMFWGISGGIPYFLITYLLVWMNCRELFKERKYSFFYNTYGEENILFFKKIYFIINNKWIIIMKKETIVLKGKEIWKVTAINKTIVLSLTLKMLKASDVNIIRE
jgi:hypothetical protein